MHVGLLSVCSQIYFLPSSILSFASLGVTCPRLAYGPGPREPVMEHRKIRGQKPGYLFSFPLCFRSVCLAVSGPCLQSLLYNPLPRAWLLLEVLSWSQGLPSSPRTRAPVIAFSSSLAPELIVASRSSLASQLFHRLFKVPLQYLGWLLQSIFDLTEILSMYEYVVYMNIYMNICVWNHTCMKKIQKKIWKSAHETLHSAFMTGKRNKAGLVWNYEAEW